MRYAISTLKCILNKKHKCWFIQSHTYSIDIFSFSRTLCSSSDMTMLFSILVITIVKRYYYSVDSSCIDWLASFRSEKRAVKVKWLLRFTGSHRACLVAYWIWVRKGSLWIKEKNTFWKICISRILIINFNCWVSCVTYKLPNWFVSFDHIFFFVFLGGFHYKLTKTHISKMNDLHIIFVVMAYNLWIDHNWK